MQSRESVFGWQSIFRFRGQPPASAKTFFGAILVVAGLTSTLFGGWLADKLRPKFPSADFLVSGAGMIMACPIFVAGLYLPFPMAWVAMFLAIFCLFLNTGPSNTAIANVSLPAVRAMAFALNIFVIHVLGDLLAFPSIGFVGGHSNIRIAFLFVTGVMLLFRSDLARWDEIFAQRYRGRREPQAPT